MAKLSSKLSPKAKKQFLMDAGVTRALVELGANAAPEIIEERIRQAGATRFTWVERPKLASIDIPAASLPALAGLAEVVYVEAAERYSI